MMFLFSFSWLNPGYIEAILQKRQFLLVVKVLHFIRKYNSSSIQPCGDGVVPLDVDPVGGGWAGGACVAADGVQ